MLLQATWTKLERACSRELFTTVTWEMNFFSILRIEQKTYLFRHSIYIHDETVRPEPVVTLFDGLVLSVQRIKTRIFNKMWERVSKL